MTLSEEEVDEEDEKDEEDEQEGGSGRWDRAGEEEDVGREWVDMTNLKTNEECNKDRSEPFQYWRLVSIRTREKSLFPAPIYSLKTSQNPKCHKILTIGSA